MRPSKSSTSRAPTSVSAYSSGTAPPNQNFDCLAHQPGETHDPVGFSLTQPTRGFPTMERRLGDAEHGEEFFHRHSQAGLQVVQLLNRQPDPEHFDQFGRSKIRGRDFAGCAMHTIADDAATGLFDAPLAAFAVDDHRARGFLRRLLGQGIAHLILLIVSFATGVNSPLDQGAHRRPHSRRAFQPAGESRRQVWLARRCRVCIRPAIRHWRDVKREAKRIAKSESPGGSDQNRTLAHLGVSNTAGCNRKPCRTNPDRCAVCI